MTERQIAALAAMALVVLGATAWLSYRWGRRRGLADAHAPRTQEARPPSSNGCLDFHDASAHIGETSCVSGRVLRVFTSKSGNSFLDFCSDYRDCPFTSVIFESDQSKFGNLSTLTGRQVEVHGTIVEYQGHAEIVVHDPDQIREAL